MPPLRNAVLTLLLLSVACAGCTDRDRELANRKGDGSDTLKYKAPDASPPAAAPSAEVTRVQPKQKFNADVSETFHYKPDSRGFPTAPKAAEK